MAQHNHGIIIGRFHPPHTGHCFLIEVAARSCKTVTLFLCSLPDEPIAGELRKAWLTELFPNVTITHISTPNPDAARDKPRALEIWAQTIKTASQKGEKISAVFASEPYLPELAKLLRATPVMVDQPRQYIRISGKQIMDKPLRYWNYLPAPVRRHFLLEIQIIGDNTTRRREAITQYLYRRYHATLCQPETTPTGVPANPIIPGALHDYAHRILIRPLPAPAAPIIGTHLTNAPNLASLAAADRHYYPPLYLFATRSARRQHAPAADGDTALLPQAGWRPRISALLRTRYGLRP